MLKETGQMLGATALVYLIARGRGMSERSMKEAEQIKQAQDAYIQSVAGGGAKHSPAEEIARAKALLDAGTISQAEYDQLKAKAASGRHSRFSMAPSRAAARDRAGSRARAFCRYGPAWALLPPR